MGNTQKRYKVFLDTSVLLSGLNSPLGASGFILSLFKLRKIEVIISPEVITEAENAIKNKFPLLETSLLDFLTSEPNLTKKLTPQEIALAYQLINSEDAPILAGATKAKADFLITLDKDFQKLAQGKMSFGVLPPSEFVKKFRNQSRRQTRV